MQISRLDEQTLELAGLDPFLAELLTQIAAAANPEGSPEVQTRLFSSPTHGAEPEFDEEWRELVEPELQEWFASSLETVEGDLIDFTPSADDEQAEYRLRIPIANLEKWIHALNQARLALAARHQVTEKEMAELPLRGDSRSLSIFQIHFYGFLQECFLRELEESQPG